MNLLTNGSFDGDTWRRTLSGEVYSEIDVPLGWTAFWHPGAGRPEMKVIDAVAPYLDPLRVLSCGRRSRRSPRLVTPGAFVWGGGASP